MRFSPVPTNASGGIVADLVEVAGLFLGPVEHHHRCRDLGQASDLAFLSWLLLIQDKAGLRIHDGEGARSVEGASGRGSKARRKRD